MELKDKSKALAEAEEKLERLAGYLELEKKKSRLAEVEGELQNPAVWNDRAKANSFSKEKRTLEDDLALYKTVAGYLSDLELLMELEGEGENIEADFLTTYENFDREFKRAELISVFKSPEDKNPCYLNIHPGAGGTESQDWAEILLRMYLRWTERRGFKAEILEILPGEEAGIKRAVVRVEGDYAFGLLKTEAGVHRLVRISPFDANKRRHTSFTAVSIYPEVDDSIDIEINETEIRIDTFRASGHGGQKVNKTDSAVRITHLPTGIAVSCQNERSQHKNKAQAMKMLKSRLYESELQKQRDEKDRIEKEKGEIAWGNQIRRYVMQPYRMIKDHRTDHEVGDVQRVLDGDIDEFIYETLLHQIGSNKG